MTENSRSKNLLILIAIGMSLLGNQMAQAQKKTPSEHWAGSGLSLKHLEIQQKVCYQSAVSFRKCLAGLDVLARNLQPAAVIAAPKVLELQLSIKKEGQENLHGLILAELDSSEASKEALKDEKISMRERSERYKKRVLGRIELENAFFNSTVRTKTVNFEALYSELSKRLKVDTKAQKNLSMIAGQAISEMMIIQDAHASIRPLSQFEEQSKAPDTIFYGVGVEIKIHAGAPQVMKIIPGGPSSKSELLKKGDVIAAVDGVQVLGMDLEKVVTLIRGDKDKVVNLEILRKGEKLTAPIVRGPIEFKNVSSRKLEDLGSVYSYIKLGSFVDENGCDKIADELRAAEGSAGIIFDLRGNGGGLLDQSQCIGGLFVGEKIIAGVKNLKTNKMEWLRALPTSKNWLVLQQTELPVVVLIDSDSASASEILAGAIQDHKRGWVVGETSFGKATVQSLRRDLRKGVKAIIGETTARFYQPSGRTNQQVGIQPDFEVPIKPDATEDERYSPREGDLFPNALISESKPWIQTRPKEVAQITTCLQEGLAEKQHASLVKAEQEADFQLLKAQEILGCNAKAK